MTTAQPQPTTDNHLGDAVTWLSVAESSRLLGISPQAIHKRIKAGTMQAQMVDGRLMFAVPAIGGIDAFVAAYAKTSTKQPNRRINQNRLQDFQPVRQPTLVAPVVTADATALAVIEQMQQRIEHLVAERIAAEQRATAAEQRLADIERGHQGADVADGDAGGATDRQHRPSVIAALVARLRR